jgi:hypothetical protein
MLADGWRLEDAVGRVAPRAVDRGQWTADMGSEVQVGRRQKAEDPSLKFGWSRERRWPVTGDAERGPWDPKFQPLANPLRSWSAGGWKLKVGGCRLGDEG